MVAMLIFSLHCSSASPGCRSLSRQTPPGWPSSCLLQPGRERGRLLIQLASLQKIVVVFADHLLLGVLGNQQSARVQLRTAFFHQA